jgi:hypothetical protein
MMELYLHSPYIFMALCFINESPGITLPLSTSKYWLCDGAVLKEPYQLSKAGMGKYG